jgi:hypothetical protein
MDIHAFTNHDIARGRAPDSMQSARAAQLRAEGQKPVQPGRRFFRRIRRRRALAATQPRAI